MLNELFKQLIQKMILIDNIKRINILEINSYLFQFKNKKEFDIEFNFKAGKILGKGTFGIVKKCLSLRYKKYFAIK